MTSTLRGLAVALSLAGAIALPGSARAWGAQGHRTVAAMAAQLLPPAKVQAMNALMVNLKRKQNQSFIDSASYADEYLRTAEPATKPWHFADLVDGGPAARQFDCQHNAVTHKAETCLFDALAANLAILRQGKHDAAEAVALSWVIHLVGDLHQPLHMEDKEVGGNGFAVTYRGAATCIGTSNVELHSVWDDCLVGEAEGKLPTDGTDGPYQAYAKTLLGPITTYKGRPEINPADPQPWYAWGDASHALAIKTAFDHLKAGDDLKDPYILAPNNAMATAKQQMLTAGIRLAYLLDTNFK